MRDDLAKGSGVFLPVLLVFLPLFACVRPSYVFAVDVEESFKTYQRSTLYRNREPIPPIPRTQYLLWVFGKIVFSTGLLWAEDATDELLQAFDECCVA